MTDSELWSTIGFWSMITVVLLVAALIAIVAWPGKIPERDEHEDNSVG